MSEILGMEIEGGEKSCLTSIVIYVFLGNKSG